MRSRVVPGRSSTMARRWPASLLKSVDLPTLGLPTMATSGFKGASHNFYATTDNSLSGGIQCPVLYHVSQAALRRTESCGQEPPYYRLEVLKMEYINAYSWHLRQSSPGIL